MEEMLRMAPSFFSSMSWAKTWVGSSTPRKFKLNTNSTPAGSRSKKLFTSGSSRSPSS